MNQLEIPKHLAIGSTKTYNHSVGLSVAFRQWRAESHCRYLHGYAIKVKFDFVAIDGALDHRNWVVDFGGLKNLKGWLEYLLDHKTLVAEDDPKLEIYELMNLNGIIDMRVVPHTGMEALAYYIFEYAQQWLKDAGFSHVDLLCVEVSEHDGNSAYVVNRASSSKAG